MQPIVIDTARGLPRLQARPGWRGIDLLSDVHLCAEMPRTFDAWRRHLLNTPADAVLILGDLFEVWVGDDTRGEAFESACLQTLREAAQHKTVAWMPGNRDFLLGRAALDDCGVHALADPTLLLAFGQRLLLSHGDALCLGDTAYQRFRVQVRGADWQREFLALPLAERRQRARAMRDASRAHQALQAQQASQSGQPSSDGYADVDAAAAATWLDQAGAQALVHGHTHHPGSHVLADGKRRHVLGDWDHDVSPPRAQMLRLDASGLHPLVP